MEFSIDAGTQRKIDEAREFGEKELRPVGIEADQNAAPLPVDHPFFTRCIERGEGRTRWPGPQAAPSERTSTHSVVSTILVSEELAYWDRGVIISLPGPGLPEQSVIAMGTEEQKEKYLGPFLEPDRPRWACFGMTEPGAGSDAAALRTNAKKDGDGWILNGAKCFIGSASRSDWILVQATVDPSKGRGGQRSFFVERDTPGLGGFKIEKKMGLKAYESTSFSLEDVRVSSAHQLGAGGRTEKKAGFKAAMQTFNAGRPVIGAQAVGMARAALDETIQFAKDHNLEKRDRVRDRIEAISRRVQKARLICLRAGWLADQKQNNIMEASMAKALGAQIAQESTSFAMELLGTVGGAGDHLIEKLYRDVKAMDIVEGTGQIQRMLIARNLVGLPR
ncbi:MAG: acyl-CoA dehydrogenase [Myxococcota bacterium]|jgi:acyl-CoA dehydrogenase